MVWVLPAPRRRTRTDESQRQVVDRPELTDEEKAPTSLDRGPLACPPESGEHVIWQSTQAGSRPPWPRCFHSNEQVGTCLGSTTGPPGPGTGRCESPMSYSTPLVQAPVGSMCRCEESL